MVLVSAVTLGCIHTPEDLELGAQTRENMLFLPFCINSLNIWSLLGIILCKHQVICTGILTFRNLLTQAFFLILEKCKSLPNNVTSFEVESLKPYKYYEVSLLAYVNGKIQRNGTAEKCNFHTKADRKFLALIFLPWMANDIFMWNALLFLLLLARLFTSEVLNNLIENYLTTANQGSLYLSDRETELK